MSGEILYKKDSKGKVRVWSGEVFGENCPEHDQAYGYVITHGVEGGKMQQETTNTWCKYAGKANQTHPFAQAQLELAALYRKKVERDGYKYSHIA